jgi:hypothetical protein
MNINTIGSKLTLKTERSLKMKRLLAITTLVLVAVMAFPTTAMAGGMLDGRVVFGGSFTLEEGETLDGDLLVMGGNVTLEVESRVIGDVVVLGGNVSSDGTIDGNVTIVGGNVRLKSNALVRGDVHTVGGSLSRSEGARIEGQQFSETDFAFPFDFDWSPPNLRPIRISGPSVLSRAIWYVFRIFLLGALAVLFVMFGETPTRRVASSTIDQPFVSGGVGLLSVIVLPVLIVFLTITLILIPVALLLILACVVAVLYGWIGLGLEVGERLSEMMKWDLHPAVQAGLGTFLFSAVVLGIGMIPCIGWIVPFVAGLLALGGVILSRFGTVSYQYSSSSTVTVEPVAEIEETAKRKPGRPKKEE